jgi:tRNA G46 methylase TrmB
LTEAVHCGNLLHRLTSNKCSATMSDLPQCDDLFLRFFDPWYENKDRKRRGFKATLPDVLQHDSLIGLSQTEASCVAEDGQQ